MPRTAYAAVALAILSLPCRADAPKENAELDALVASALAAFKVPGGAVVVVKDDAVVYLNGFGVRKQGGDEKVTPDTSFAIASCTKAFTATLLAMLADEGKLAWDDKVRKHLE